jgi:rod shape-determining protein MreD
MRNLAFLSIGILLILLQANAYRLLGPLGLNGITPSLVLPLVVYLGVHEPSMPRGAFLAFLLGHAVDIFASAPIFLFTFVYVAIWWLSRLAGVRLTAQTMLTRLFLAFAFALVEGAIVLILLAVFGSDTERPIEIAHVVLPRALSTALFAPAVFRIAHRLAQGSTPVRGSTEGASA